MTRAIVLLLAVFAAGCAATNKEAGNSLRKETADASIKKEETAPNKGAINSLLHRYTQSRSLTAAVEMLGRGEPDTAAKLLTAIINSGATPGVTDEALFRLALLSLKPLSEKEGNQLLKRLKNEYPASPWTVQAGPLLELLADAEELRRQNKNYKNLNQSLSKEVNELNENLNKLKNLDLELERKAR